MKNLSGGMATYRKAVGRGAIIPHLSVCLHVQRNPKVYQVFVRFSLILFDLFAFLFIFAKAANKNCYTVKEKCNKEKNNFILMQVFMAESEKKLQFLLSLMESKGVGKNEIARMMGVTPQNVFTYFKRDDIKLSYAQEIANKLGYDLSFRLESEDAQQRNVIMEIEGLVGKDGLQRLAFLRVAMSQNGIERKDLAEKLGISYTGVNRWFKVDDIAISYLYKIAELYGLKVKIKGTVRKDNVPDSVELS